MMMMKNAVKARDGIVGEGYVGYKVHGAIFFSTFIKWCITQKRVYQNHWKCFFHCLWKFYYCKWVPTAKNNVNMFEIKFRLF